RLQRAIVLWTSGARSKRCCAHEARFMADRWLRKARLSAAIATVNLAITVSASAAHATTMKIRITLNDKTITATLIDSETTRDFISLLPLTLTMNDLFGREKFGHLPRSISEGGKRTRIYEVGDVIYWSPGPDVAMYYRHDGQPIPSPGII